MKENRPMRTFRAGNVSAALFRNEMSVGDKKVPIVKVTVERRYRDEGGNWKSSNSYNRNEVPLVIHCLQAAFSAMIERNGDAEEQ